MRAPSDSSLSGSYAYTELKGVQYGPGCLSDALPKFIEQFGVKRALVVTGRSLHTKVRREKRFASEEFTSGLKSLKDRRCPTRRSRPP